jgi:hypothetical protein
MSCVQIVQENGDLHPTKINAFFQKAISFKCFPFERFRGHGSRRPESCENSLGVKPYSLHFFESGKVHYRINIPSILARSLLAPDFEVAKNKQRPFISENVGSKRINFYEEPDPVISHLQQKNVRNRVQSLKHNVKFETILKKSWDLIVHHVQIASCRLDSERNGSTAFSLQCDRSSVPSTTPSAPTPAIPRDLHLNRSRCEITISRPKPE